jgi:hypothetical protein
MRPSAGIHRPAGSGRRFGQRLRQKLIACACAGVRQAGLTVDAIDALAIDRPAFPPRRITDGTRNGA